MRKSCVLGAQEGMRIFLYELICLYVRLVFFDSSLRHWKLQFSVAGKMLLIELLPDNFVVVSVKD